MLTPKIERVDVLEDYKLLLYFKTGEKRIYDMKKNLQYECFKKLKDKEVFNTVKPAGETIEWDTGEDVNPDDLYFNSKLIEENK